MWPYRSAIFVVICFVSPLVADESDQEEQLKAGDAFLKTLPDQLASATRREYFELTSFGKFLGIVDTRVRLRPRAKRENYAIEYDAVIRYPDGTRVTSEGRATADASFSPKGHWVHQTQERTDGSSAERTTEITFDKKGINIKRKDPNGSEDRRLPLPEGPFVMVNNQFIEAVAASKVKSLAVRDLDPELHRFVTKEFTVKSLPDGLIQVDGTKIGEKQPSETYIVGKKGRVLGLSKGGEAEVWRRIKKAEYQELKQKLEAPPEGKQDGDGE